MAIVRHRVLEPEGGVLINRSATAISPVVPI
jgi:hypothetical protein